MSKQFPNLISQIFNRPMLATPELLHDAVLFARSHLGLPLIAVDGEPLPSVMARIGLIDDDPDDATGVDDDGDADGTGVAQIGIYGPLVARTGNLKLCTQMTAYESLGQELDAALADSSVYRIVLDVDSNGGDSTGAFEAADRIRAANLIKPVHAIVHFSAFSGGYLLASAAGEVSVSQSSGLGSIGVIAQHMDVSRAMDSAGVTVTTVYRGARKADLSPTSPLSDGARAALDGQLDRIYHQFTTSVAAFRSIPLQAVAATDAGLYFGQAAIDAGLADRLETPQEAFDRIVVLAAEDRAKARAAAPDPFTVSTQAQRMRMAAAAMAMSNSL
ncbi:S49 family peptidase [Malikia sp.]|uniref:S49 family peptidase n=1 Tax=Malikia sp. TaxID=2070706 RepID=UPI00260F2D4C|nr:S49 family peptidase [Malikia sp.]MDD2728180.1 S49 family peptidase [Malikia sp.]